MFEQALKAIAELDRVGALAFITCESGPETKPQVVAKFRHIQDAQEYHRALVECGSVARLIQHLSPPTPKRPIEEIAHKFRRDVLPHIRDLVDDNQFEGYVFAYIMAHDGWDWSNARDVEFLSLFSSR